MRGGVVLYLLIFQACILRIYLYTSIQTCTPMRLYQGRAVLPSTSPSMSPLTTPRVVGNAFLLLPSHGFSGRHTFPPYPAPVYSLSRRTLAHRVLAQGLREELRQELRGEEAEEAAGVPPLVPAGWVVTHAPTRNALLLRSSRQVPRAQPLGAAVRPRDLSPASPFVDSNEMPVRHLRRSETKIGERVLHPFGIKPMDKEKKGTNSSKTGVSDETAGDVTVQLTILAHFEMKDPSLSAPHLNTCEYLPFTLRVFREDKHRELWCSLAYANCKVVINKVAIVPRTQFRGGMAPEIAPEHVFENILHPTCESASSSASGRKKQTQTRMPSFEERLRAITKHVLSHPPRENLLQSFVRLKETVEEFYPGPRFADNSLNSEFLKQFTDYFGELGITESLGEYIAQASYFYENEEYQRWIARLSHFADPKPSDDAV